MLSGDLVEKRKSRRQTIVAEGASFRFIKEKDLWIYEFNLMVESSNTPV